MSNVERNGFVAGSGPPGGYLPFSAARTVVHGLMINAAKDYRAWSKSGQRPVNIPSNPDKMYPEFVSWPDWLGTAPRPYDQAIAYVHPLGINTRDEWEQRYALGGFPRDIPKWPQNAYKEFTTWADFLGRRKDFRFRSFEDARSFMRPLGLKSRREHTEFVQSDACPKDIPSDPAGTYAGKGWVNYADYLGLANGRLNTVEVLAFVKALRKQGRNLSRTELYTILCSRGVVGHRFATNRNGPVLRALQQLCHVDDPDTLLDRLAEQLKAAAEEPIDAGEPVQEEADPAGDGVGAGGDDPEDEGGDEEPNPDLLADPPAGEGGSGVDRPDEASPAKRPANPSGACMGAVDDAKELVRSDEALLAFMVENRLALLWQETHHKGFEAALALLGDEDGGDYLARIRRRFLEEYEAAVSLPVPAAYAYEVNGRPAPPTLMQKQTALRLLRERRVGNWSDVGTGKTIAAILSAMVVKARLTVVVAFNSTLDKWEEDIRRAYPSARVLVKERGPYVFDPDVPTFLIFNYETFQQEWSESAVLEQILGRHPIDFIVLDEIHSARERRERPDGKESARRRRVKLLVEGAAGNNPEVRVLAMSATPVVNNLHEARVTLELVTGKDLGGLPTRPRVENAIEFHKLFRRHGIRYRADYSEKLGDPKVVEIDAMPHLRELLALPRYGYIPPLERVLLKAKLAEILRHVRPGTLIYTQFVTEMVEPLERAIRQKGLTVGLFTGEEKGGLRGFLDRLKPGASGAKDVLIGSAPIGTGIDGLQKVCDRLIFACLPWTRAEYDQVVGRLTRLEGVYDKIEVIIPEVVLRRPGGEWSWDRDRRRCIEYKRTIADAAVDGVLPQGRLPTPEEMYRQSMTCLARWEADLVAAPGMEEEAGK